MLSRPNHSIHQVVAVVAAVAATLSFSPALSTPFGIRKIVTSAGRLRLYSRRTEREQKLDLLEMLADVPGKLKRAHIIFSMRCIWQMRLFACDINVCMNLKLPFSPFASRHGVSEWVLGIYVRDWLSASAGKWKIDGMCAFELVHQTSSDQCSRWPNF